MAQMESGPQVQAIGRLRGVTSAGALNPHLIAEDWTRTTHFSGCCPYSISLHVSGRVSPSSEESPGSGNATQLVFAAIVKLDS